MTIVHALLAVCVAGVVAFLAPFSRLTRALIVFSYHFVYEYAVIARSYVLTVLLLFLIAAVWRGRRRPVVTGLLLFLLFNTNAHGFLIAGVIWSAVVFEAIRRREWSGGVIGGIVVAAAGGVLAFVQLLPPADAQRMGGNKVGVAVPEAVARAFVPYVMRPDGTPERLWLTSGERLPEWVVRILHRTGIGLGVIVLGGTIAMLRRRPIILFVFVASVAALLYVFVFKWFGFERHAGLILLLVLFAMWMTSRQAGEADATAARWVGRLTKAALAVSLAISCALGLDACLRDVCCQFSGSREAAEFIRENGLEGAVIAAFPDPQCTAVLPYLRPQTRFWFVGRQEFGSYMLWDKWWYANFNLPIDQVLRRVEGRFPDHNVLLLLAGRPIPDALRRGYRLLYQGSARVYGCDEYYFLYGPAAAFPPE
jgi:hypothetical protein